jgi:hypothetical protein
MPAIAVLFGIGLSLYATAIVIGFIQSILRLMVWAMIWRTFLWFCLALFVISTIKLAVSGG